jgi:hypothetical protein
VERAGNCLEPWVVNEEVLAERTPQQDWARPSCFFAQAAAR